MLQFFISSTFEDMVGEREILHQEIIPKVNEYAKQMGEYVECTDLRWGVDTDHMGRILEVCLSQIKDPCNYNMLVFVGKNYGSVPDETDLIQWQWKKEAGDVELEDYAISVTQLEIEYGIFVEHQEAENAIKIVLFRTENDSYRNAYSQDKKSEEKQVVLLDRLKKMKDLCQISYSPDWNGERAIGLDKMKKQLVNSLKHLIEEKYDKRKKMNWVESISLEVKALISQLTHYFYGRGDVKADIVEHINDNNVSTVLIYGESASGKSSLMARVFEDLDTKYKYFIACGHIQRSRDYLDVLIQMIYFVEKSLRRNETEIIGPREIYSEEQAETVFLGLVNEYNKTEDKNLFLFVDALDQLSASGEVKIHTLLAGKGKVKIICSWMRKRIEKIPKDVRIIRLIDLTEDDIAEIVTGNMVVAEENAKTIIHILCDQKRSGNPLYISSALDILQMNLDKIRGKNRDEIYKFFCDVISDLPERLPALCWSTLDKAGQYLNFSGYKYICGMIAASNNGLRSGDLYHLFQNFVRESEEGNTEWKFDLFKSYLNKNLYFRIQENGCWVFGHDIIKEGVEQHLENDMQKYKEKLFEYIKELPAHDEVRIREGLILSSELEDISFPKILFEQLLEEYTDEEVTLIVRTMYDIVFEKERAGWYYCIIDNYEEILLRVLEKGLHYKGGVQYDRRYPAKWLMDLYWNVSRSRQLCNEINSLSGSKQKEYCSLCAQYVGIYDDISDHKSAFMYELSVYEFMKKIDFNNLSSLDKGLLYEDVNLIFYSNNKIIANMRRGKIKPYQVYENPRKISEDIINWYKENIRRPDARFEQRARIEGKFISNIGQYYEAVNDYKTAYSYRAEALKVKAENLFSIIAECGEKWKTEFEKLARKEDFVASEHEDFWTRMLKDEKIAAADWENAVTSWKEIAVSYRTIATDCFYLANSAEDNMKKNWIQKAIEFHGLCIFMKKQGFVSDEGKEIAVTYIRQMGAYWKLCKLMSQITDPEQDEIISCAESATSLTVNYALQDLQEPKNLRDNLENLIAAFREKGLDYTKLQQCCERIKSYLTEE